MKEEKYEFSSIGTVEMLLSFLQDKGGNHNNYHHYTDLDSLIKIIDSGYFHFTRGNATSINDQHECLMKGSHEVWDRTYLASFGFGDSENMAMWGLYGLPWEDAVRISIPRKAMKQWVEKSKKAYGVSFESGICIRTPLNEMPNICLSDIVYIDGKQNSSASKLYWNDKTLSIEKHHALASIDSKKEMTGFIKNNAWKYENEVRIHVQFKQSEDFEKIAISIPTEVINAITITAGPYFRGDLVERIEQRIPHVIRYDQAQNSGFTHLVNYRTICNLCKQKKFTRK